MAISSHLSCWVVVLVAVLSLSQATAFAPSAASRSLFPARSNVMRNTRTSSTALRMSSGLQGQGAVVLRRALLASAVFAGVSFATEVTAGPKFKGFKRIRTQFIAALGDPKASSGTEASQWGLWREDPGPRGVWLRKYADLQKSGGKAPAGWKFDNNDWWLEEHGLIMEAPEFPVPTGRYLVTGGRETTTVLTVSAPDAQGKQQWSLDDDAKLYDVTHLPCRSARYTPNGGGSPATAKESDFPVAPGAEMPAVQGCNKQDYAVLFVIGVENQRDL